MERGGGERKKSGVGGRGEERGERRGVGCWRTVGERHMVARMMHGGYGYIWTVGADLHVVELVGANQAGVDHASPHIPHDLVLVTHKSNLQ